MMASGARANCGSKNAASRQDEKTDKPDEPQVLADEFEQLAQLDLGELA